MIPPDLQKSSVIRYRLNKIIFTECRSKKKKKQTRERKRESERDSEKYHSQHYEQQGPLDDNRKNGFMESKRKCVYFSEIIF